MAREERLDPITNRTATPTPVCIVTPVPVLGGERRTYRGLAQPFAAHAHSHYVIGRVREGERELELNGKPVRIGPGSLVVFNPDDVHGCRAATDAPFAYDSVTIAAPVLDGARLRFPKTSNSEATEAFENLLRAIEEAEGQNVLEQALYLASCLDTEEGADDLYRNHGCPEDETDRPSGDRGKAAPPPGIREKSKPHPGIHEDAAVRTLAHLRGHLAQPHSVAELAAREGLSPYALIRAYRRRFAITPLQHLISMRVECACELLAAGASPAAVAAETGFADQAHLTRVFKQRLGTTPAAYRKMAAEDYT